MYHFPQFHRALDWISCYNSITKHTFPFTLGPGAVWIPCAVRAPAGGREEKKKPPNKSRSIPISDAEGGSYSHCFEAHYGSVKSAGCKRWQPLTHHYLPPRLCSPVKPERLFQCLIHRAPPLSFWMSRWQAGSPLAGSDCRGQTAMQPNVPILRKQPTLIHGSVWITNIAIWSVIVAPTVKWLAKCTGKYTHFLVRSPKSLRYAWINNT